MKPGPALEAVLEVTQVVGEAASVEELYRTVFERVPPVLGAERAMLFRLDEAAGLLWSRVPVPDPAPEDVVSGDGMMEIALPLDSGAAGHVAQTGEVVNAANCLEHPLWLSSFSRAGVDPRPYLPRTGLTVPVKDRTGKVVGVLQVTNKRLPDGADPTPEPVPVPTPDGGGWPVFTAEDERIARAVASAAALAMQNAMLAEHGRTMFKTTVEVLFTTLDWRDPEAAGHSRRVSLTAAILAKELALPPEEAEKLRTAGLLHDIGKVGVPEALLRYPGRLPDDAQAALNRHAGISREILGQVEYPAGWGDIPLIAGQHHERLDGSGFPEGLVGEAVVPGARVLAVADVFDALRMRALDKAPKSVEQALAFLREGVGRGELDESVVEALERAVGEVEAACAPLRPPESEVELGNRLDEMAKRRLGG